MAPVTNLCSVLEKCVYSLGCPHFDTCWEFSDLDEDREETVRTWRNVEDVNGW